MTADGDRRSKEAYSTYFLDFPDAVTAHPFDTFEDLGPYDRCITRGLLPSMLPTAYNMGNQIFQIPGFVIIRNEMIHETRVIPLDGRPHVGTKIRSYMGDSRGHWEGDTLVIESSNFNGKVGITRNGNTLPTSPEMRIVERITRVDATTLQYQATVTDPATWTRPWTVSLPLTVAAPVRDVRVRVPRRQLRDEAHPERRAGGRKGITEEHRGREAEGISLKPFAFCPLPFALSRSRSTRRSSSPSRRAPTSASARWP